MDSDDRRLAEAVLRHLLVGRCAEGVRFGEGLDLLFTPTTEWGQPYLALASRWTVLPTRPQTFPDGLDGLPAVSEEGQLQVIYTHRWKQVSDVELGDPAPHVIITFDSGEVLFHYGGADGAWEVLVTNDEHSGDWMVSHDVGSLEVHATAPYWFRKDLADPTLDNARYWHTVYVAFVGVKDQYREAFARTRAVERRFGYTRLDNYPCFDTQNDRYVWEFSLQANEQERKLRGSDYREAIGERIRRELDQARTELFPRPDEVTVEYLDERVSPRMFELSLRKSKQQA